MDSGDRVPARKSLSLQQAVRVVGVAFVIGLLIGLGDAYALIQKQRAVFAKSVTTILALSHVGASDALSKLDGEIAEKVVTELIALDEVMTAQIRFINGDIFKAAAKPAPATSRVDRSVGKAVFASAATGSIPLLDTWHSSESGPETIGALVIDLDSAQAGGALVSRLLSGFVTGVLQALVIGLILAFFFHRFLSRPLRTIGQSIGAVDLNNVDATPVQVPEGHSNNELGMLVTRLNSMLSKLAEGQDALRQMSTRDPLTGLPNRALVHEMLEGAIARANSHNRIVAVLFIDLDRFKQINDTLGYDSGDQLLRSAGLRLTSALKGDEALGRLGGDEFVVIAEDLDGFEQAASISRRMERAMAGSFRIQGHHFHVSASIGISLFPIDSGTPKELISQADVAMYNAKTRGGGFQFFSSEMSERAQTRLKIESNLRMALERQEFELFFQPKINLMNTALVGCEALIRWRHEGEFVPPDRFIPIAEQTSLILPIGEWVLSEACRVAAKWERAGYRVPMSVNVSARQVVPNSFVQYVRACIDAHGMRPEMLELEITETAVIEHLEEFKDIISELRMMGIKIAIDDFGTGYSSLAYIRDIEATALKIDRHFIKDLPRDGALVSIILGLARDLKIEVVAEGVEEQAQVKWLQAHGCQFAQGHLFSRALTEHHFQRRYLATGSDATAKPASL